MTEDPELSAWRLGYDHSVNPLQRVRVQYRDGSYDEMQHCEVDWSQPDPNDLYSATLERSIRRWRMIT